MAKGYRYWIRKTHRYLGIFIGIQLLLWTLGGLYFSWSNIDRIHGDHFRKSLPRIHLPDSMVSPDVALAQIRQTKMIDSLESIQIVPVLGTACYQICYYHDGALTCRLAYVNNGRPRPPLSREEAIQMANSLLTEPMPVKKVEYLESVRPRHEYRGKPLPAWAVTFDHKGWPTFYVAAERGTFVNIRHRGWRVFDFLWMLHTMDYQSRDKFGNTLLRAFSILGLVTVLSGFLLFFTSSPVVRRILRKRNK